jgi:predicted PolB exonuclease-like 3'-5' exonuclease
MCFFVDLFQGHHVCKKKFDLRSSWAAGVCVAHFKKKKTQNGKNDDEYTIYQIIFSSERPSLAKKRLKVQGSLVENMRFL